MLVDTVDPTLQVSKSVLFTTVITIGVIVALATPTPIWVYGAAIATAIAGTSVGTRLLMQWNDHDFRRVSRVIILSIASLCIIQGIWDLVN